MDIELRHIHKRFGSVHANNDINTVFPGGRIIGVLGENGAGKSTLMKILSGFQPADEGEIWIDGEHVNYHGPEAAIAHGIGMLQQDPLDVGAFTVLENFTYGRQGGLFLSHHKIQAEFTAVCRRLGFTLDAETRIGQLSIAQRQQLEIVRLLALGVKVLILDEPTTGISADQKDLLFNTLRDLARDGMTILLVSHKLEDVIALCDEVVVLRGGCLVGAKHMPATKPELVALMFGQALTVQPRKAVDLTIAPVVFEVRDAHIHNKRLDMQRVNLQVRAGEVIGLAGLDGSGQELFMRACAGLVRMQHGQLFIKGKNMTGKPYRSLMQNGLIFGAAGRLEEGLISGLTLTEHVALVHETGITINWQRARQQTEKQIALYNVRGTPNNRIEMLSGGNQQRVLLGLLPEQAAVLVLEQPTRGLDVDSARWIWEQLLTRREHGTAIIFSSAELDELVAYSDRIIVFYAGQIYCVDDPGSVTVNDLGHFIGGEFEV